MMMKPGIGFETFGVPSRSFTADVDLASTIFNGYKIISCRVVC